MNGFSYENKDGVYELRVGAGYTGEEQRLQEFARKYWEGPCPITLYLGEGVSPRKVADGVKGWLLLAGVNRFIKDTSSDKKNSVTREGTASSDPRWERDIENLQTLLHIVVYQAVDNIKVKIG